MRDWGYVPFKKAANMIWGSRRSRSVFACEGTYFSIASYDSVNGDMRERDSEDKIFKILIDFDN